MLARATKTVLGLATLGDAAQVGSFLFVSLHPAKPGQVL